MRFRSIVLFSALPACLTGLAYEAFLGHRHDYSGHYLAGYGATFAAAIAVLGMIPARNYQRWANRGALPFCCACILGGVVTEATVFRLARFDEVDFFNQSLGAVLATVCAGAYVGHRKCTPGTIMFGLMTGLTFLWMGGILAFS
ncbi:MAG: hypothetical protein U0795_17390 [Pirellulales bacterium]